MMMPRNSYSYVLGGFWRASTRFGFVAESDWTASVFRSYALGLRLVRNR